MTRKKKTRSLKRIHNVKTGNRAKLKRSLGNDRQVGKRVKGRRNQSVYEKFLEQNPEAKEQQQRTAAKPAAQTETDTQRETSKKRDDAPRDLLSELDKQDFNDIY
ncbi:hypothetical protein GCM10011297_12630 [Bacterioplanes sanyensis]|uniref:hypothetical protein n=1 Tax=Bacterioplanes sanyensis TaxID=1249553 RepID=UPI00167440C8|nr:hypothetical protein [Bacterioplanes sanyensis]GGY41095.1 hypothetical protein GCM10011297_12630 [Bacterioplanes sanyensis]